MQAIDSSTTAEVIAHRVRSAILRGTFAPGDRLVEQELSESFAVSRGPVREAIRLLAADGVVVLRKNRGAVVACPTADDILEVYALRLSLGTVALAAIAQAGSIGPRESATLTRLVAKLRDSRVRPDADRMIDADLEFQGAAIAYSGLPRFTATFRRTDTDIRLFVRSLGITYGDHDHAALAQRHDALVAALSAGDAHAATSVWQSHITASVREFLTDDLAAAHPGLMGLFRHHP